MGITGFWPFLKETLDSEGFETITLEDLRDKTLLFDTKGLIYKVKQGPQGIQLYLGNFIRIVHECRKYNITPIFIMDGIPPKSKQFVNKKRKETREKKTNDITELQQKLKDSKKALGVPMVLDAEEIRDMNYGIKKDDLDSLVEMEISLTQMINGKNMVSDDDVAQVYFLLERMGCWVIRGHGEGEALCAFMNRLGYGYAVVSDDSDSFPFGAKKLIRNWNLQGKKSAEDPDAGKMKLYDCDAILAKWEIDIDKMIEICILCGNDFSNGIKPAGFGFKTSFLAVKELGMIDKILERKVKENKTKKRKNPFEIPKGFEPEVPRREFYCYAKYQKPFSYIQPPKELKWNADEIVSFFKANKMSILIPTFCNFYKYVFKKEYLPENAPSSFEQEIKLPPAPILTIEENLEIDKILSQGFKDYALRCESLVSKQEETEGGNEDEAPSDPKIDEIRKKQREKREERAIHALEMFEEETNPKGQSLITLDLKDSKEEVQFIKPKAKRFKPILLTE